MGIAAPLAPELDRSDEDQAGERAEHPEHYRVADQDPEFPLLGDRRCGSRPGRGHHGQRSFTPDQLPCVGVIPARNSPITRMLGALAHQDITRSG